MANIKDLRRQGYGRGRSPATKSRLPNNPESLAARKAARQMLEVSDDLLVVNHHSRTKPFQRDFTPLTQQYPEVKLLALQLLAGAKKKYAGHGSSYTTLQDLYFGIEEFLRSVCGPETLGGAVDAVEDLNVQVAKNFDAWLLETYPGRTLNRKRFGKVRAVVEYLKKKFPDAPRIGVPFTWPPAPRNTEAVSEGYATDVFNALTKACLQDIRFVQSAMRGFDDIKSSPERIVDRRPTLEELIRIFGEREMKWKAEGRLIESRPSAFENTIRKSPTALKCISAWGMTMDEFVRTYRTRRDECMRHEMVATKMRVDADGLLSGYTASESYRIAMATMANSHPYWPIAMECSAANDLFSYEGTILGKKQVTTEERKTYRVLQRMKFGYQALHMEVGLMAYFAHFFFTAETIYPLFLYVQINTGWNEEVIVSLTDSLDAHIEPDIVDPDYVLIYGSKYRVNKAQACRSNKSNPMSVYRILRFIESVLQRHCQSTNYLPGVMWQFVLNKNLWNKYHRVTTALDNGNIGSISENFLRRHGIVVDPEKKVQRIESRRLRTTYETRRRESGLSIEEVSPLLGHGDIDTTDKSYDSDKGSTELKNKRIRELQTRMLDDFKNYSARLISNKTLAELRDAIGKAVALSNDNSAVRGIAASLGLTEEQTVHLLSPKGQTYISACIDRREPTWPDARLFVPIGEDCTFFNRCCLCDKSLIFKEALPYIARRIQDIQQLRLIIPAEEWAANYADETTAWEQILVDWRPSEEVAEANLICREQDYILPLTMRGA